MTGTKRVVVIGAGAFGGWTALELQRRGAQVVLIDAWGPGNGRSSSGGETRAIRALYGVDERYVEMVVRARVLWERAEREWGRRLMDRAGALWMFRDDDSYARAAIPALERHGVRYQEFDASEARRRYPQIDFADISVCLLEPDAGMLYAKYATQVVRDRFVDSGGTYRTGLGQPGPAVGGRMDHLRLGGEPLQADAYVFACGAWLPEIFPEVLKDEILPTREEVMFFGTPPGGNAFHASALPVWIDMGPPIIYGLPGGEDRGFKISDDTRGAVIDPTREPRDVAPSTIARMREYLAYRFPAMADAPLLETRVCQYENSPDGHYVIDRHPDLANVWVCGGGSGHGFKMGPVIGELMARIVLDEAEPPEAFRIARLGTVRRRITQFDRR